MQEMGLDVFRLNLDQNYINVVCIDIITSYIHTCKSGETLIKTHQLHSCIIEAIKSHLYPYLQGLKYTL